jgi:hypothetical protein
MIELDVDNFFDGNESVVIVCYPTGVKYTAQAGGTGCTQPSAEGFLLFIQLVNVDDHDYLYGYLLLDILSSKRLELANHINDILINETKGGRIRLEFDFSRVDQLQEGWWPVKIKADLGYLEDEPFEGTGWLHNGNCD